jgi:AbrB family looped-hinge helix DNA binding protein
VGSSQAKGGQFIPENASPVSKCLECFCRKLKLDSKGRISIPSELRKNFGLDEGFEIELFFDLRKSFAVLIFNAHESKIRSGSYGRR